MFPLPKELRLITRKTQVMQEKVEVKGMAAPRWGATLLVQQAGNTGHRKKSRKMRRDGWHGGMVSEQHNLVELSLVERGKDKAWEAKASLSPEEGPQLGGRSAAVTAVVWVEPPPLQGLLSLCLHPMFPKQTPNYYFDSLYFFFFFF